MSAEAVQEGDGQHNASNVAVEDTRSNTTAEFSDKPEGKDDDGESEAKAIDDAAQLDGSAEAAGAKVDTDTFEATNDGTHRVITPTAASTSGGDGGGGAARGDAGGGESEDGDGSQNGDNDVGGDDNGSVKRHGGDEAQEEQGAVMNNAAGSAIGAAGPEEVHDEAKAAARLARMEAKARAEGRELTQTEKVSLQTPASQKRIAAMPGIDEQEMLAKMRMYQKMEVDRVKAERAQKRNQGYNSYEPMHTVRKRRDVHARASPKTKTKTESEVKNLKPGAGARRGLSVTVAERKDSTGEAKGTDKGEKGDDTEPDAINELYRRKVVEMQEHFPLYDSDGDGLLTVPQFQQVMQLLRLDLEPEEVASLRKRGIVDLCHARTLLKVVAIRRGESSARKPTPTKKRNSIAKDV